MNKQKAQISVFLLVSLLALIAVAASRSNVKPTEKKSLSPMKIAIVADPHYIAPDLTDGGEFFTKLITEADGKAMMYCEEISDAFISQIIHEKPDALVVVGDLSFNGELESLKAYAAKLQAVKDAGIAVLTIPGNHDINYGMAAKFTGDSYERVADITPRDFYETLCDFGFSNALSKDEASLSYVYPLSDSLRALMIDVNTDSGTGVLNDETLVWAERQLIKARLEGISVIAFSHQTLMQHNSLFTHGFCMTQSDKLLELYKRYSVICNFCGHMHLQHFKDDGDFTELTLSPVITSPCQYGILDIDGSGLAFTTETVEFEHAKEAKDFFIRTAMSDASGQFPDDPELAEYIKQIHWAYMSGRMGDFDRDEEIYKKLQSEGGIIGSYLASISEDSFKNFTEYRIEF